MQGLLRLLTYVEIPFNKKKGGISFENIMAQKNAAKGPFIYYVINILTFLDPTHPVCNQSSLINQTF